MKRKISQNLGLHILSATLVFMTRPVLADQLIIHGGSFYNESGELSKDAILVSDGVIRGIGNYEKLVSSASSDLVDIDTKNRLLLPGLIDSHVHTAFAGFQKVALQFPQESLRKDELKEAVSNLKDNKNAFYGEVFVLMNVPLDYWSDLGMLSEIFNGADFSSIPVVLAGSDAHTGWINVAMQKFIQKEKRIDTYDKEVQKQFNKNSDGDLTGFVSEQAWDIVTSKIPPVSQEKIEESIMAGACELNSYGITAWMDPIINIKPLSPIFGVVTSKKDVGLIPSYISLSKSGRLHGKVTGLFLVNQNAEKSVIKDVVFLQERFNQMTSNVQLKGIKILQDGVIEPPSQTARLSSDYLNKPGYSGGHTKSINTYHDMIAEADKSGLIVHAHVIGDRAANEFINAIEFVRKENKNNKTLHSATHLQIVQPKDIQRLKELGIAAVMQPLWASGTPSNTSDLAGTIKPELLKNIYPMGSIVRSETIMAGASDWPVSTPNPFLAMYTAMTRKGADGILPPPTEIVENINDMIDAYTINGAKVIGRENEIGSISLGKKADLVLLDRDITASESNLKNAVVEWTMIDGKIVFEDQKCK